MAASNLMKFALVVLLSVPVLGQPAEDTPAVSKPAADTPEEAAVRRAALDRFLAMTRDDGDEALVSATGDAGVRLRAFLGLTRAQRRASEAWVEARGMKAEMEAEEAKMMAVVEEALRRATVEITGEAALVRLPVPEGKAAAAPGLGKEVFLQKEDGVWKLDAVRTLKLDGPKEVEDGDLLEMTRAYDAVAEKLRRSPEEAKAPLEALVHFEMMGAAMKDELLNPKPKREPPKPRRVDATREDPMAEGELLRMLPGGRVRAIAVSPDGTIAASGGSRGSKAVVLWDLGTGAEARPLELDRDLEFHAASVAFSPDGGFVAAGGWAYPIADLIDARRDAEEPGAEYDAVEASEFAVRVWRVSDGRLVHRMKAHAASVLSVDFSPDGSVLASASEDGTVRLWDAAAGMLRTTVEASGLISAGAPARWPVGCVRFSRDGKEVYSASAEVDLEVRVWDAATGAKKRGWTVERGIQSLTISPSGEEVACARINAPRVFKADGSVIGDLAVAPRGFVNRINAVAYSPDSARVVVCDGMESTDGKAGFSPAEGSLWVFERETGRRVACLTGHLNAAWAACVTPDGKRIVSASADGSVRVWRMPE